MDNTIGELLVKHFNQQASEAEELFLTEWVNRSTDNKAFYDSLKDKKSIQQKLALFNRIDKSAGWQRIENSIETLQRENEQSLTILGNLGHNIRFLRTAWFLRSAAAIIIIAACAFYFYLKPSGKIEATANIHHHKYDLAPGGNKAILTLADGSTIVLDSAANGQLAKQGGVEIVKLANGQLSYLIKTAPSLTRYTVSYNTLRTPKGGQYQITLPDGTQVWLNAASSITYPTSFSGDERIVEMSGEAYFEVTKNAKQPFKVNINGGTQIQVLGTHFNINAYTDEKSIKTSLLEGSVRIGNKVLKPGEAYMNGDIVNTNLDQDIAWKNGVFNFHHVKLPEAMRQISRWYDVDIHFEEKAAHIEFGGKMGRNLTLQQVLRGLEGIDNMHFTLEGKTLSVIL